MFEKEAEEIAKDIYIHHFDDDINYPDVLKAITVGVQKGTEHGYNKAKKYARKTKKVDWEGFDVDKEARKEGYIAGATENGIVWHDLRKNPDDLPDNTDCVLSDKGVIVYYNFTHACWVDERASVETDDVIAWCEIPQFKEE